MINIAAVGAGAWGKNHIRVFSELPNVRLKYVCDSDPSKLASVRKAYPQSQTVENLKPILQDPEVRGVVVASSAISHYPLTKEILLAGKDVLVEKPMALNEKDAEEMLEIAEKKDRILMVGHLLIYHSVVDRLKEMISSGELGKIHYIYTQRVNLGVIRQDENALMTCLSFFISSKKSQLSSRLTEKVTSKRELKTSSFSAFDFQTGKWPMSI
jgi:UDP-2-acetamido-3-amino-2,3-dideoxy-glucuronate N-acetyltransferase